LLPPDDLVAKPAHFITSMSYQANHAQNNESKYAITVLSNKLDS
jgi:hypothetical protein